MYKKVLFTTNDLDGAGCSVLATISNIGHCEEMMIVYCDLNNIDKTVINTCFHHNGVCHDTKIIFAGICPQKQLFQKVKVAGFPMLVIDSHFTNRYTKEIINDAIVNPYDMKGIKQCATSLMYNWILDNALDYDEGVINTYFNTAEMESFVENIRKSYSNIYYDKQSPDAVALAMVFSLMGLKEFIKQYISKLSNNDIIKRYTNVSDDNKMNLFSVDI